MEGRQKSELRVGAGGLAEECPGSRVRDRWEEAGLVRRAWSHRKPESGAEGSPRHPLGEASSRDIVLVRQQVARPGYRPWERMLEAMVSNDCRKQILRTWAAEKKTVFRQLAEAVIE